MTDTETSKRAEANRRNAQKSTGPKTAEGKARSRFNAVKHGMRANASILPGEDAEAFQARLDRWTDDLGARDDVGRFLVRRAVQLSWQLERADRAEAALAAGAEVAAADRLAAIADEVVAMGRRLFWDPRGPNCLYPHWKPDFKAPQRVSWSGIADDPDDPARLLNRLESTAIGCAWLLDRWGELRDLLEDGQKWLPPDRFRAIRLLGRQPLDVLEDRRVLMIYLGSAAIEPDNAAEFGDMGQELQLGEAKRFLEGLNARDIGEARLADAEAGRAALLQVLSQEEVRLEEILEAHLEREQAAAEDPGFDAGAVGERLRRYQGACDRALLRVLEAIRRRRRDAETTGPAPTPTPRPPASTTPRRGRGRDPIQKKADQLSAMIDLIRDAKARDAANEARDRAASASRPEAPIASAPQVPATEATGPEAAANPSPSPAIQDDPSDHAPEPPSPAPSPSPRESRPATNEPRPPARTLEGRWQALLAVLVLLFGAGLAATLVTQRDDIGRSNLLAIAMPAACAPPRPGASRTAAPASPVDRGQDRVPSSWARRTVKI